MQQLKDDSNQMPWQLIKISACKLLSGHTHAIQLKKEKIHEFSLWK